MAIVAPSLLAANFLRLEEECKMLNESEADWFHLDVMDGRFVPNISYGPMIIEFIRKTTKKPCDVHLMILEPEKFAEEFKKAGADHLTVHIEACPNLHRNIQQIKSLGMQAGVAINPHTPVTSLIDNWNLPVLIEVDGGVTLENAKDIIAAGADVLVAGNTVFKSKDPRGTISQLRSIETAKTL